MLREPSLTLQKAAEFVRAAEASKEQFQSLKGVANSSFVNAVKTSVFKKNYKKDKSRGQTYVCEKCGSNHKNLSAQHMVSLVPGVKKKIISRLGIQEKLFTNFNIIMNCSLSLCQWDR